MAGRGGKPKSRVWVEKGGGWRGCFWKKRCERLKLASWSRGDEDNAGERRRLGSSSLVLVLVYELTFVAKLYALVWIRAAESESQSEPPNQEISRSLRMFLSLPRPHWYPGQEHLKDFETNPTSEGIQDGATRASRSSQS